ncbi:hypothetical protein EI545_06120 [Tabrizicola piscis]|uniref:DUF6647 domain-containing protein n=1 Tax=Tabrizicola piscis TaxID=2494374 RepID=A0A3S8U4G1_9RHOB|nr:DUF6647 family protein [Tabrizicola piscis]AZL58445.1 hypothetical protein EI545_06120 [Tabrizicola piscis]
MRSSAAALALSLCLAPPALAGSCAGMGDLLTFIEAEGGYSVPSDCPTVDRSDLLASVPALRSQVGAFIPATGHILLAHDLDTDSTLGRSYLLHELVHAAQYRSGAQLHVRCEGELEREAYRLQTSWLRQKGEFREAMLLDWAADALGRCPGDKMAMDY